MESPNSACIIYVRPMLVIIASPVLFKVDRSLKINYFVKVEYSIKISLYKKYMLNFLDCIQIIMLTRRFHHLLSNNISFQVPCYMFLLHQEL